MQDALKKNIRNIIIFGTGEYARRMVPFVERKNRILFFADNDISKWGSGFGKYIIKSPQEIKNCKYDVVVMVSSKYVKEIVAQLMQMGINNDRIYCCYRLLSGDEEYEIYPLNEKYLQGTETPLIQYDLFHSEECKTDNRKVMVLCSFYSVYTKQLIENMSKRYKDIEFSLLTTAAECKENIMAENLKHIYCFRTLADLKKILQQLPIYDAMQVLWIEWEWSYFYRLIRMKTKKLNLNVGGSDFYRSGTEDRNFKRKLIEKADIITAETEGTLKDFKDYYGTIIRKTGLLPFGVEVLDFIKKSHNISFNSIKKKFGIPVDKIIVTCGHNANRAHQHMEIIEAVSRLREDFKKQMVFVFPMTYNQVNEEYIREVADSLEKNKLEYVILTEFMDFQKMAEYAMISDIMIHVQTTDQLSSTMLEEMYAGSIIIAGSWLPYKSLHEMGIYFLDVDTVSDITCTLQSIVLNMEEHKKKCAGNRDIIWKHSSWDELAPKWNILWE